MLRQNLAGEGLVKNFVTEAIVRYRRWFFGFLVLLYLVSFNGRWRIGLDSSIYRGLASNLAQGKGFTFGTWGTQQAYPGLPLLLAGVMRLAHAPPDATHTGNNALAFVAPRIDTAISVGLITLMGAATIALTYRLIRMHYPEWMAICVTFGMGINAWFLQLCNELLTDIPFLLGVVAALYGWELLKRAPNRAQRLRAMMMLTPGLLLAGAMRPTFWVLAAAWGIVCAWGMLFGPRRKFHAACLVMLLTIWTIVQLIDPRHRGFHPFSGGYEREAIELLPDVQLTFWQRTYSALRDQLPASFFGEQMAPVSAAASIVLLGSCLLLFRRHALWGLMVFITFGITLALSTQPRYYTMVLPMLLLGWLLMLVELVKRLPALWGTIALAVGLGLVTFNNISAMVSFVKEQRSPHFLRAYKDGKYIPVLQMCDVMIAQLPRDARVLGPSASIMSYVTGLHVFSQREILGRGNPVRYPKAIQEAHINYAVLPAKVYHAKERMTERLLERGLPVPVSRVGGGGGMHLWRVRPYVPPGDWRILPKGWRPPPPSRSAPTTRATTRPIAPVQSPVRSP